MVGITEPCGPMWIQRYSEIGEALGEEEVGVVP